MHRGGVSLTTVVGALLGSNVDRQISIVNSFEIIIRSGELDVDFIETRREQFKQVFPALEVIGWYSSGISPTSEDARTHQKFAELVDRPIFLLHSNAGGELPILIYEAAIDNSKFIPLQYGIETGEAERIAVEGVSVGSMGSGDANDAVLGNLTTQRNAIKMLYDRVLILSQYVNAAVASGKADSSILQQVGAVSASLPIVTKGTFHAEFAKESGDVDLTKYLSLLTQQLSDLNDYADKHNVVFPPGSSESGQAGPRHGAGVGGAGVTAGFGGPRRR